MVTEAAPLDLKIDLSGMTGPSAFLLSRAKYSAMFGGTGSGKTIAGIIKMFSYMIEHPGAYGVITEPNYNQIERALLPGIEKIWGGLKGRLYQVKGRQGAEIIDFANGSKIWLTYGSGSGAADALRGLTLAAAWMDEAAVENQHQTFMVLQSRLRQEGYPAHLWITTTPQGRNWLYWRFVKKQLPGQAPLPEQDYEYVYADTGENRHNPPDFLPNLIASYGNTPWAAQEIHGQFVSMDGLGYPMFSYETHVKEPPLSTEWKRRVAGVDYGSINPTAIVEVSIDKTGFPWATREYYQPGSTLIQTHQALIDIAANKVVADPSAKEFIETMRRMGITNLRGAKGNDFSVRNQLVGARLSIQPDGRPGIYISPRCPNLIEEIQGLSYARARGTEIVTDRWQNGQPDHAHDALGYALKEIDSPLNAQPRPGRVIGRWGHSYAGAR